MGIFGFYRNKHENKNNNNIILNNDEDEDDEKKQKNNKNNINEIKIDQLCLKIHIVGTGEKKHYVINNIFKEEIKDHDLKTKLKVTKEFKTEQFHWIVHIHKDGELNNEDCKEIEKEIKEDRRKKENENILIKNQIILCFGNENVEILSKNFTKFKKSNMIFITETKCQLDSKMDKRYAINIIYKDIKNDKEVIMSNEDLNIKIISVLWELDCYFKEKGNLICRYTPDNIFNGLENDNPLFTLNILLIGLSRAGKSTFINLLSRKLSALEAELSVSVTKNISEYYIYKDDDSKRKGAIKLIDTPGFVANKEDKLNDILNLIKNNNQGLEHKVHFIFFIIMNGAYSFEGNNINEVFKALNESKVPVIFILNRVKKNRDIKEIITPIKEHFNQNNFKNLSKDENFVKANFLKADAGDVYGFDEIFKKISNHFKSKKYLDDNLIKEMKELLKEFRLYVESNELFLSSTDEGKKALDEFKENINFTERMNKINEIKAKNELLNQINIDSMIEKGRLSAKRSKNIILSLSNLKGVLPEVSRNVPALSIYQAVMVKEIGAGYGLDIDILNSGTKCLLKYIKKVISSLEKDKKNNKDKIDDTNINIINIEEYKNVIGKKALELMEHSKNTVVGLADILYELYKLEGKNEENADKNKKFSNAVYEYCIFYFEKQINESKGLVLLINYFNNFQNILKDIDEYYIPKKDWENFEIEIKK